MADVISVSSDDSDVEIVGSYNNVMTKADPLPLTAVRVDIDVVNANVPPVRKQTINIIYIQRRIARWIVRQRRCHIGQGRTGL